MDLDLDLRCFATKIIGQHPNVYTATLLICAPPNRYSLAVFLPESGNRPQTLLSHQSILGALKVEAPESKESSASAVGAKLQHKMGAQDDPRGKDLP